jgi:DNA-binding MarR family transcriptional regulator
VNEPQQAHSRIVEDVRDELRTVNAVYRSARAQRRHLIWRAADNGVPHAEIAEILGMSRSRVSQIVRALESRGDRADDFIEDVE